METDIRSDMVLKAFLSRCPPEKKRELERFLPEGERLQLEKLPSFEGIEPIEGFTNEEMLERVHWSWFLPTLKTYTEQDQKHFLSAVNLESAKNLTRALGLSFENQEINEVARSYFRQILLNSLLGPHNRLLPTDYLPQTSLKPLLNCSKKELVRIIDLLSLYDLAAELRQIVETKILKKIYSFLSEEERNFLKSAMAHKESFALSRIGLDRWDGAEDTFRLLLHRRGLMRFGAALSGQDPDFIWYICHQLDIGRGNALFKLCAKEAMHGVTDPTLRQIEELLA